MDAVYLICLLVGGFFVALSALGGDTESDFDADVDFDLDADVEADIGAGTGLIDLFSLRFVFLFAAFFGLTGVLLGWAETGAALRLALSIGMGLVIGLGGNYVIKTFGYRTVSSEVSGQDLIGRTAYVTLPFSGEDKGKISLVAKETRLQLVARGLDDEVDFEPGDEVVVVRLDGRVAEVVKPN